jgi:hypothetical protein
MWCTDNLRTAQIIRIGTKVVWLASVYVKTTAMIRFVNDDFDGIVNSVRVENAK